MMFISLEIDMRLESEWLVMRHGKQDVPSFRNVSRASWNAQASDVCDTLANAKADGEPLRGGDRFGKPKP